MSNINRVMFLKFSNKVIYYSTLENKTYNNKEEKGKSRKETNKILVLKTYIVI